MRGAAKIRAGADGLVDDWCSAPFEVSEVAGQGRPASVVCSWVVLAMSVTVCKIFVSIRRLLARGSGEIHRMSSLKTMSVCSYAVTVGRLQW